MPALSDFVCTPFPSDLDDEESIDVAVLNFSLDDFREPPCLPLACLIWISGRGQHARPDPETVFPKHEALCRGSDHERHVGSIRWHDLAGIDYVHLLYIYVVLSHRSCLVCLLGLMIATVF